MRNSHPRLILASSESMETEVAPTDLWRRWVCSFRGSLSCCEWELDPEGSWTPVSGVVSRALRGRPDPPAPSHTLTALVWRTHTAQSNPRRNILPINYLTRSPPDTHLTRQTHFLSRHSIHSVNNNFLNNNKNNNNNNNNNNTNNTTKNYSVKTVDTNFLKNFSITKIFMELFSHFHNYFAKIYWPTSLVNG
mgnify:CR=1 FL=1